MQDNRMDMVGRRLMTDRRDDLERRLVAHRRISVSSVAINMRQSFERRLDNRREGIRRLFPDRRSMDSGSFAGSHFMSH